MKKKPFVVFEVILDGKNYQTKVYTENLRKVLDEAKADKDLKELQLRIHLKEQSFNMQMSIKEIRKLIKQSELLAFRIIPNYLSKYLLDATKSYAPKKLLKVEGRDDEIEKIWFYLSQDKRNNVFLVGPTDVGKTTLANEIIREISTNECPKEFYDKRVILLKVEELLKIKSDKYFEYVVSQISNFLEDNKEDIVLYIDKAIYMKTDYLLATLLNNVIVSHNIPFITTASVEDYEKYFFVDATLSKHLNYLYIDEPELEEIEPIIKNHILSLKKQYKIKISPEMIKFGIFTSILTNSVSANPGNVINVFERAFLEAKRKDKKEVDKASILSCYNSYLKMYNATSEEEKKLVAYHETGHYIVSIMSNHIHDEKIAFVSILPMMDFLGVNWPYKILGKTLNYTKDYFLDSIAIYMAGRIAEKLISKEDSTGASSDLSIASSIAEGMITTYGFSEVDGSKNRSYVTQEGYIKSYLISEKKKQEFGEEIQKILEEGYKRAEKILEENKGLLDFIAEKLFEEEILTGEELERMCREYNKNK